MTEPQTPRRAVFRNYRLLVGAVLALSTLWLTVSVLLSVGVAVYGGTASPKQRVRPIAYTAGGNNTKALRGCGDALQRMYGDLRDRMFGIGTGEASPRGERKWKQWLSHWQVRLQRQQSRCLISEDAPDHDDPILEELASLADKLESLSQQYGIAHTSMVSDFREHLIEIEGILGRIGGRLKTPIR